MTAKQEAVIVASDHKWHKSKDFHNALPHGFTTVRKALQSLVKTGVFETRYACPGPEKEYKLV